MKQNTNLFLTLVLLVSTLQFSFAQNDLITNIQGRKTISLNGTWHYIIDPYETGFYNYRYKERNEDDKEAYWNKPNEENKIDRVEHGYEAPYEIKVPGDWNSQKEVFKYYEGTVWYQREFDVPQMDATERVFLHFGAVNYEAHVYLNGKKLGMHKGGFTAFNFEIPKALLQKEGNFLVVKVDNKRYKDEIPTLNTDWWNYGGITRDVNLVITKDNFITNYGLTLNQDQDIKTALKNNKFQIDGSIKLNAVATNTTVTVEIPELKIKKNFTINGDEVRFSILAKNIHLWSPDNPKLYEVSFNFNGEKIKEKIGFRKIETSGNKILLNGTKIFLRGICIHEEVPQEQRRAYSKEDADKMFKEVKELNANMVRLAHYPHNEYMLKAADSLGIMVWSEIPVYWAIDFGNEAVLQKAKVQLEEMITRDRNKASLIIWSVGNETPVSPTRTNFMKSLITRAKELDKTRLVSAALEVAYNKEVNTIDDPLGQYTDIVSVNEYLGWYGGHPNDTQTAHWKVVYDKPLFFSETGAGAKGGYHADKETRWSEEYQEWFYEEQIKMMKKMPENYCGLSPWILRDFRSPKRNHPKYQEGWNRKGLIDDKGNKKKAFFVLQKYYKEMAENKK
ncbi:glycoside hydrolase family 2 protein [Flavobacterium cellulosilyticum]|uniref:Beta-glucuronidase n=1 Tax=Flavobacterium cellulosilyticum TaxID=2541731 RepID=A0A4R5C4S1_9FLAO|nr:glycoside hydrolase family 2 TIM barrel-domain containing protein [Flavobacterium cellulosilyticum]TDD94711.1 beta-glucuronidase [Flavobacterium cellulosilyticum]